MARATLVDMVADEILRRVIDGELPEGAALPSEAEIGAQLDVSRLTVREGLKELRAKNVLNAVRGRGTYVNSVSAWTSLEAVLRSMSAAGSASQVSVQLLEVRRMIEVGAAELAAARRTEADLELLRKHLAGMVRAQGSDVDRFVTEDIAFHDVILRASGNLMVPALYEPLGRMLGAGRRETSAVPAIQEHAIQMHRNVLAALESGSPEAARTAMLEHMDQTLDDLRKFVLATD
ncbi:FadR/GntR family transcriptional regulator [Arthrobacter sp. KK5.5]|uniref:FadR/GntR family transcriptional regulator n=1 Tax=Arthrobacter sp. KK5.5 TaxID=3373084 RepID=UPI003EE7F7A1